MGVHHIVRRDATMQMPFDVLDTQPLPHRGCGGRPAINAFTAGILLVNRGAKSPSGKKFAGYRAPGDSPREIAPLGGGRFLYGEPNRWGTRGVPRHRGVCVSGQARSAGESARGVRRRNFAQKSVDRHPRRTLGAGFRHRARPTPEPPLITLDRFRRVPGLNGLRILCWAEAENNLSVGELRRRIPNGRRRQAALDPLLEGGLVAKVGRRPGWRYVATVRLPRLREGSTVADWLADPDVAWAQLAAMIGVALGAPVEHTRVFARAIGLDWRSVRPYMAEARVFTARCSNLWASRPRSHTSANQSKRGYKM